MLIIKVIYDNENFRNLFKDDKLKASILSILGIIDIETFILCPSYLFPPDYFDKSSKLIAFAGFFMFIIEDLSQLIIQVSSTFFFDNFWLNFIIIFIFNFLIRLYIKV